MKTTALDQLLQNELDRTLFNEVEFLNVGGTPYLQFLLDEFSKYALWPMSEECLRQQPELRARLIPEHINELLNEFSHWAFQLLMQWLDQQPSLARLSADDRSRYLVQEIDRKNNQPRYETMVPQFIVEMVTLINNGQPLPEPIPDVARYSGTPGFATLREWRNFIASPEFQQRYLCARGYRQLQHQFENASFQSLFAFNHAIRQALRVKELAEARLAQLYEPLGEEFAALSLGGGGLGEPEPEVKGAAGAGRESGLGLGGQGGLGGPPPNPRGFGALGHPGAPTQGQPGAPEAPFEFELPPQFARATGRPMFHARRAGDRGAPSSSHVPSERPALLPALRPSSSRTAGPGQGPQIGVGEMPSYF